MKPFEWFVGVALKDPSFIPGTPAPIVYLGGQACVVYPPLEEGIEEGDPCNRGAGEPEGPCPGTMGIDGAWCTCFQSAPCSGCMYSLRCDTCGTYTGPDGDRDMDRYEP